MGSIEDVYGAFIDYYGDIPLQKIKEEYGFYVYAAQSKSGLNDPRYIFAVVPSSRYLPDSVTLNQIDWVSLQTRIGDEYYKVPSVTLLLDDQRKRALQDQLQVVERTHDRTNYVCQQLPIKVSLMHDQKKKNSLQYPDQCKLYQALESYRCVVELM